ncbi:MAG: GxxExxY protein [Planctomycetes bacterium]|nr:GxxExxY protein [Planctomycetota bacterium]
MLVHEELTGEIIAAAIEVHRLLGPGLLESAYERCLCRELSLRNLSFETQVPLHIDYKGLTLEEGYRLDLVVAEAVVIEIKCVDQIVPVHEAQLLTYLRLSGLKVGLLINFQVAKLKDGITRRVL